MTERAPLRRRVAAEAIGTGTLVAVIVGSGVQADRLTSDAAVTLLANALATVSGLAVLIAVLGPVSGAHLNPAVSLTAWWTGRRAGGRAGDRPRGHDTSSPTGRETAAYCLAQIAGAVGGAALANVMFGLSFAQWSQQQRAGGHLWLAEAVATAGLIVVIQGPARTGHARLAPASVACYIGAAYWFTSSTAFANPAVTIGRIFTDTYTGIAPASAGPYIAAQLVGAAAAIGVLTLVYGPAPPRPRADSAVRPPVLPAAPAGQGGGLRP